MNNRVAFFYVDFGDPAYRLMAEMMIASVHLTNPDYSTVMLTDSDSVRLGGTDLTARANYRITKDQLMPARMILIDAFLKQADGNVVFADPDVLFINKIDMFSFEFDVGLTWRDNFPSMPFNTGVMATRTTEAALEYWKTASIASQGLPDPLSTWYGDQIAVAMAAGLNAFHGRTSDTFHAGNALIKLFTCAKYNYSPDEYSPHDANIIHLKGDRKSLMIQYFRDLCEKELGIKNGFIQLSQEDLHLIYLQRTDYTSLAKTNLDSIENTVSAKYTVDLYNEYRVLKPHLPKNAENILDIGCGLAGIDYFLYNHYRDSSPNIFLLDKTEVSENIYFGFEKTAAAYNNLDSAKSLLTNAGIPEENVETIDINVQSFSGNEKFDFIYSSISWGFHYPVETYINEVKRSLTDEGCLIIDVRKNTNGANVLRENFSHVSVIHDTVKYEKILVKK